MPSSSWQKYKQENSTQEPWRLITGGIPALSKEDIKKRLDTCNKCSEFIKPTRSCRACTCNIEVMVLFKNNSCPMEKW